MSLLENLGKHQIVLRDSVIQECINFLENCEGKFLTSREMAQCGQLMRNVIQTLICAHFNCT